MNFLCWGKASGPPTCDRESGWGYRAGDSASAIAQVLAIGLVTVTPWIFGGVQAAVQPWLVLTVACALLLSLTYVLLGRDPRSAGLFATLPLLCGVGLAALQLFPLDRSVHQWLSPCSIDLRDAMESRAPSADASLAERFGVPAVPDRQPLSLYPAVTRRELAIVSMAAGMFAVGAICFAAPRAQLWLCILIASNGALLVLLGIVQKLTWNGLLYWQVPLSEGGGPFGPFVNQNNAGGFLSLCLAGALGWTVWAFGRDRAVWPLACEENRAKRLSSLLAQRRRGFHAFFARLNAVKLAALLITAWLVTGVLCSLSRGAWVAMTGATLATAVFVSLRRRRILWVWLGGILGAGAIALVGWSGMWKRVTDRLGTLLDEKILTHGLVALWHDSIQAARDFWLTGTGLGTFRYVYGMYYQQPTDAWFHYAENQYLQAIIETGVFGLVLIVVMIAVVGLSCRRIVSRDLDPRASAFAIAGLFALVTQAIHACFDFGLSVPANVFLFALLCGALVGRASAVPARRSDAMPRPRVGTRLLAVSAIVVLLAANAWAIPELQRAAAVDTALRGSRLRSAGPDLPEDGVSTAIEQLSAAVDSREDDAEGHQRLARLWIHAYRTRVFPKFATLHASGGDPKQVWALTLPVVLHGRIHLLAENGSPGAAEGLRNEPAVRECLLPAMYHFVQARRHCPLLPYTHLGIAELCGLFVDPNEDRISLERARRLAPADPKILFESGLADLNAGRREAACESFRQCLALGNRYLSEILEVSEKRLSLWEVVERVLPDSPQLLLDFAGQQKYQAVHYTAVRHRLAQRAFDALEQSDLTEDEKCHLRASALVVQERYGEAIAQRERAVQMRPRQLPWRYELALLLKKQGSLEKAHEHVRVCAILNPSNREYRKLLEEVNLARLTVGSRGEGLKQ